MEARLGRLEDTCERLEALMTRIDDRLRKVEIELAEIKGRIGQIPTTWQMITFMVTSQIAFAGVLVATLRFAGHS